jgi:hypothetical protein
MIRPIRSFFGPVEAVIGGDPLLQVLQGRVTGSLTQVVEQIADPLLRAGVELGPGQLPRAAHRGAFGSRHGWAAHWSGLVGIHRPIDDAPLLPVVDGSTPVDTQVTPSERP